MIDERTCINLLKKDLQNQARFVPETLYNENIFSVIVIALKNNMAIGETIRMNAPIFEIILNMYPELLKAFNKEYVERILTKELTEAITNGKTANDICKKYDISNRKINVILEKIKLSNPELYNEIMNALNKNRVQKRNSIIEDINNLNIIISLLGPVGNNALSIEQKIKFAYLYGKYIHNSLEEIYNYEYKNIDGIDTNKMTHFFNGILKFAHIYKPTVNQERVVDLEFNNNWHRDYDKDKFFGIKNGIPTIDNKYGKNAELLTLDIEQKIIEILKEEGIPLKTIVVKCAFREFFKDNLFEYINMLKEYSKEFEKLTKIENKKLTLAI